MCNFAVKLLSIRTSMAEKSFITDDKTTEVFVSLRIVKEVKGLFPSIRRKLKEYGYQLKDLAYTNDIWARDYMPVEIFKDEYLSFKYYPTYYDKEEAEELHKYADTDWKKVRMVDRIKLGEKLNYKETNLFVDGGNVVKAIDKNGVPCLIMTDKVLTDNECGEDGVRQIISECTDGKVDVVFIPWEGNDYEGGVIDNPIGHSDGVLRYLAPGKLLLTNTHELDTEDGSFSDYIKECLQERFEVFELSFDGINCQEKKELSWCYINFLQVGKVILLPRLSCEYDEAAIKQTAHYFSGIDKDYVVDMIDYDMSDIVRGKDKDGNDINGGGALNCLSWTI